jgi:hypothetical protein
MKKLVLSALVAALLCSPAWAELTAGDRAGAPIVTATNPVAVGQEMMTRDPMAYDSLYAGTAGYWGYPAASGPIGFDDYDFTPGVSSVGISALKFVGGVQSAGMIMWFDFFTAGGSYINSLGAQFPQGGNWIWTLNISSPPYTGLAHTGILQLVADTTYGTLPSLGQWYFTSADALIVGSNNVTFGPPFLGTTTSPIWTVQDFALVCHIPEPATLALLGSGLLVLVRRR